MKRRSNDTKLLASLLRKRGKVCEFCKCPVIQVAAIPPHRRVKVEAYWIEFATNHRGFNDRRRIATIEHVQRLADGGTYLECNLKIACAECNQTRNKKRQKKAAVE